MKILWSAYLKEEAKIKIEQKMMVGKEMIEMIE